MLTPHTHTHLRRPPPLPCWARHRAGSHTLPWVDFDPVDGAGAYSGSSSDLTDGNNVTAAQTLQFVELIALPTILSVLAVRATEPYVPPAAPRSTE